jgi:ArsR family transcriptional regulator
MEYEDILLQAFENKTRREILKRLIEGDQYAFQLSKDLKLSQQAIMKNLELLEKLNIIECKGLEKSELGAPRKKYKIGDNVFLTIVLTQNMFEINTEKLELEPEDFKQSVDLRDDIEEIDREIEQLNKRLAELISRKNSILKFFKDR